MKRIKLITYVSLIVILSLILILMLLKLSAQSENTLNDKEELNDYDGVGMIAYEAIKDATRLKDDKRINRGSDCRSFSEEIVGEWKFHESDSILRINNDSTFIFQDYPVDGFNSSGEWQITEYGLKLIFDDLDEYWSDKLKLNHDEYDWGVIEYSYDQKSITFEVAFWILGKTDNLSKEEKCERGRYSINVFNTLYYRINNERPGD